MTPKPKKWEEEFDKNVNYDEAELGCNWSMEDLKQFISNLLSEQKQELREKIEKVKKEKHDDIEGVLDDEYEKGYLQDCSYTEAECYNAALDDILKLL